MKEQGAEHKPVFMISLNGMCRVVLKVFLIKKAYLCRRTKGIIFFICEPLIST